MNEQTATGVVATSDRMLICRLLITIRGATGLYCDRRSSSRKKRTATVYTDLCQPAVANNCGQSLAARSNLVGRYLLTS